MLLLLTCCGTHQVDKEGVVSATVIKLENSSFAHTGDVTIELPHDSISAVRVIGHEDVHWEIYPNHIVLLHIDNVLSTESVLIVTERCIHLAGHCHHFKDMCRRMIAFGPKYNKEHLSCPFCKDFP